MRFTKAKESETIDRTGTPEYRFDEIKKTVSLETVIHHYGIPLRRVGANTLRGKCPLPSHSSKENKESFTATLTKGTGGAWACQSQSCIKSRGRVGGNVLDFVAAMEQCSIRDAAIILQTWFLVPAAGNSRAPKRGKEPHAEISAGKEPEPQLIAKKKSDEVGRIEQTACVRTSEHRSWSSIPEGEGTHRRDRTKIRRRVFSCEGIDAKSNRDPDPQPRGRTRRVCGESHRRIGTPL